ncbi:hypothetical protein [uncultured Mucilaginibacter sp.]|uniref:hypothetical protein n=1 Tax=uncultured Mucilaginibacter sp. TaxID=797541 RepID=UPI0025EDBF97|nr:hypothetical protein [uncultured Mucilaginibacter sp.]
MKPITIFNRLLSLSLLATTLFSTSCKKDNNDRPKNDMKLVKLEESATSYTTFDYNSKNQVVKMTSNEGTIAQTFNVLYENNQPSLIKSSEGSMKFIYINKKLDATKLFADDAQTQLVGQIKLNYLNERIDNMVISHLLEGAQEPTPIVKSVYEYYANGDVKKQVDYVWNPLNGQFKLSASTVYEYDDKVNPLIALGDAYTISFKAVSKHNPVKETEYDENNELSFTTTYTYTYNSNAYPVTAQRKITAAGKANSTVSNFKYTYQ